MSFGTTFTHAEIDEMQESLGLSLPGLYRELLVTEGAGPLGENAEIYDPREVRDLYELFFEDPAELFAPYFPFGCDNDTQELWIIDAASELAATVGHETVPEDWPEEEWLPYDIWVRRTLDPMLGR